MKRGSKTTSSGMWGGLLVGVTALALALVPITAQAVPILDFNMDAAGQGSAVVQYLGGAAALTGTGIDVDTVLGINTPSNSANSGTAPQTCLSCVLTFTSGEFDAVASGTTTGWVFGSGGSISIVGGVDFTDQNEMDIALGTTLLTGTITGAIVIPGTDGVFKIAFSAFNDFKDEKLLDFYGLPTLDSNGDPFPYTGNFNLSFFVTGVVESPDQFTSSIVLSGDVTNSPVPEPGSILLLGSGLAGLGLWGWRRKKLQETA